MGQGRALVGATHDGAECGRVLESGCEDFGTSHARARESLEQSGSTERGACTVSGLVLSAPTKSSTSHWVSGEPHPSNDKDNTIGHAYRS